MKRRNVTSGLLFSASLCISICAAATFAQETQPPPSAPRSANVPAVSEKKLANGLTVAVVERRSLPLVTVQLLIKSGASAEDSGKAGLANTTASLLTKGTKTRTATQIAEDIEFLGGSIDTGAGWNNSTVTVTATSDKLEQVTAILADVVLNPSFKQEEIDLLRSQTLDGLSYNLKQPGFLASYVASKYSFGEHPAGGTPSSIASITQADVSSFHSQFYGPDNSVVIFTGDISLVSASALAEKLFGQWARSRAPAASNPTPVVSGPNGANGSIRRVLVVDLPNSGQASVNYARQIDKTGRSSANYFPASVLNSVLGGGYSSRLNQEIRIKRGLSYGAGSGFSWRSARSNFSTRTQTKNESTAEVGELIVGELRKLGETPVAATELVPRKSSLTGGFGLNLETNGGLAAAVAELYSFGLPAGELNLYVGSVQKVTDAQIRDFAGQNLLGGDIIIVGDYKIFKDDLAKRFPNVAIDVIKADDLDLSKDNLRK
jgi:zinc protease